MNQSVVKKGRPNNLYKINLEHLVFDDWSELIIVNLYNKDLISKKETFEILQRLIDEDFIYKNDDVLIVEIDWKKDNDKVLSIKLLYIQGLLKPDEYTNWIGRDYGFSSENWIKIY